MPTRDDLSDDPDVLRRQAATYLLGHCQLMACHDKAGRETLLPGWPVTILTELSMSPLTRDELDRLPLTDLFPLIHKRLRAWCLPGLLPARFAALDGYTELRV